MEQQRFVKQAVDFQRNAFTNAFQAVVQVQDQVEQTSNAMLEQANLIPEEGKKAIGEWAEGFKKGREAYKNAVLEGFNQAERILGGPQ
jgi:cytochrome c5